MSNFQSDKGPTEPGLTMNKFSKWGMLKSLGITEDMLLSITMSGHIAADHVDCSLPDIEAPSYGALMELYYFTQGIHKLLNRNQNRLLKLLVDNLFPAISISRSDRQERKLKGMCDSYCSMPAEEQVLHLQKCWRPQPTGWYF